MEPILKTIAREYSLRYKDLTSVCFLFPNKRCGIFFKKYLAESGKKGGEVPHILTISELVSQIAKLREASRIEQLFTLYKSYLEVANKKDDLSTDFEAFRGWGEIVLSDFNTVDTYLVEPNELFKNVSDYRKISSNFLTEEQKEVMKEYFGVTNTEEPLSSFWKHFSEPDSSSDIKNKFLNLWQVLSPLHDKFLTILSSKGLGSTGSIYREAVKRIKRYGRKIFPYQKIVVVGFNALTGAEREIFKAIRDMEGYPDYDSFADFIWDASGPILNSKNFNSSKFVTNNRKYFQEPAWIKNELKSHEVNTYPEISIISSPSLTSQTKVAAEILTKYNKEEEKRMIADAEVALILPDESLLSNMLYSLPDDLGDINLTMGYSLRQSSIASFMSLFRRLYAGMRESDNGNIFYAKDLKRFLTHPYSFILFNVEKIESFLDFMSNKHKISINIAEIDQLMPEFGVLMNLPSKKEKAKDIFGVLYEILNTLIDKLSDSVFEGSKSLDIDQIKIYTEYVEGLEESLKLFDIEILSATVIQLIDKLIANEKIGFEGEPLSGLQVMGTLESRSLDFRHLIILSMNEGIMPRKAYTSTFIPDSLRKAYGLPPARYSEEIFGYYFYRLISRAEKISLIYDGRTISGLRGGISRYILQLRQYVPKEKLHEEVWEYPLQNRTVKDASLNKNSDIYELAECFSASDETRKNFSASSLNTYRECQVKFFLENMLNLNADPDRGDVIDPITIGNILHNVMMELYMPESLQKQLLKKPLIITKPFLQNILSSPDYIWDKVLKNINKYYYGEKNDSVKEIESGITEMIGRQLVELITSIVKYDLGLAPFNLYGCEISEKLQVALSSGRNVNFRFAIDRLDEIEFEGKKRLRIVDYKTGSRKRSAKSIKDIFEGGYSSEQIFQLFTYAWLLGKKGMEGWEEVITEIYYVPDLVSGKGGLPELDRKKVTSIAPYIKEFSEELEAMIESIFSSTVFKEANDSQNCSYCAFRSFCQK